MPWRLPRPLSLWVLAVTLLFPPACARAGAPGADESVRARVDGVLSGTYLPGTPGAAVLVARGGEIVLDKGYGLANLEHEIQVAPDTVFRLASVTKIFTSTAILMLADEGKLSLADDMRKYLPDYPKGPAPITVGDLLSHTSGIPEYLDRPDNMQFVRSEFTVEELIASFSGREPEFVAGTRNEYRNSNYVLLGAIIEKISGTSFAEYLRNRIFLPTGMSRTYCDAGRAIIPGRAASYEPVHDGEEPDWSRFLNARFYTMSALYAAGGCLSTTRDLYRFQQALADGRLIRKETLTSSYQPVTLRDGTDTRTGRGGWQLDRIDGHAAVMKGGALPGVCTWFLSLPEEGTVVILLSNRSAGEPRCGRLALELARLALGR